MTIIEKIKAEIERLKADYNARIPSSLMSESLVSLGKVEVLNELLFFLSTLESEKPMNQDGLEEELERFIASGKSVTVDDYGTYKVSYHDFKKVARHFAEWQKEKDDRLTDIIYQQGIEKGKDDMKEQMMKEAKEVRVQSSPLNGPLGISAYCCNFPSEHPFYRCKEGDKVRIIIVKEN